jgi:hypothetical protein
MQAERHAHLFVDAPFAKSTRHGPGCVGRSVGLGSIPSFFRRSIFVKYFDRK